MTRSGLPASDELTNRGAATRARLLDCALTLFAQHGYEATSVRDIIRAAGVTQPTLYYYARSKPDLFLQLIDHYYGDALDALAKSLAEIDGCEARLRHIARSSISFCAADPRVPRVMFPATYGPPISGVSKRLDTLAGRRFAMVRAVVQAGIDEKVLRRADADGLALAFCCLIDQHLHVLARQPRPQRLLTPTLADWLVELFLHGAAPVNEKGRG